MVGHRRHEPARAVEAGRDRFFDRFETPVAALHHVSERDPVRTREDPDAAAAGRAAFEAVVDPGLRGEEGELALDGGHRLVAEQGARAETRAVGDERFVERHEVAGGCEVPDPHASAEEEEFLHQPVEEDRRLDAECRPAEGIGAGEGMFSRLHHRGPHVEARVEAALGLVESGIFHAPTREAVCPGVRRQPRHAAPGSGPPLHLLVGCADGPVELGVEGRGPFRGRHEVGERREAGVGHVRGRVGREGPRVDRHVEPAALELPGGGEADGARSDDGGLPRRMRFGQFGHEQSRPPRKGDSRAAVAVVVDNGLLVQPLRGHAESGGPEGPETHGGPDDAVRRDAKEGEAPGGGARRKTTPGGGARAEARAQRRGAHGLDQRSAFHAIRLTPSTGIGQRARRDVPAGTRGGGECREER